MTTQSHHTGVGVALAALELGGAGGAAALDVEDVEGALDELVLLHDSVTVEDVVIAVTLDRAAAGRLRPDSVLVAGQE